jgi:hypothetical protein
VPLALLSVFLVSLALFGCPGVGCLLPALSAPQSTSAWPAAADVHGRETSEKELQFLSCLLSLHSKLLRCGYNSCPKLQIPTDKDCTTCGIICLRFAVLKAIEKLEVLILMLLIMVFFAL